MEKEKKLLRGQFRISTTIAGFIILISGITILFKTIWIQSPLEDSTAYVVLFVGLFLILLGTLTVNRGEAIKL